MSHRPTQPMSALSDGNLASSSTPQPPARSSVSRYSQLVQLKMRNAMLALQAPRAQDTPSGANAAAPSSAAASVPPPAPPSGYQPPSPPPCDGELSRDSSSWNAGSTAAPWTVLNGLAQEHIDRLAAHPQSLYQPMPEQQQQADWFNKDGSMYSAFLGNTAYDTNHPVFDLASNGYMHAWPAQHAEPEQHAQQQQQSVDWSSASPDLGLARQSDASTSSAPLPRFSSSLASPPAGQAMAELSRYQQLVAAKFPGPRSGDAHGGSSSQTPTGAFTRSPRGGLYADNAGGSQIQTSPSTLSNASLSQDPAAMLPGAMPPANEKLSYPSAYPMPYPALGDGRQTGAPANDPASYRNFANASPSGSFISGPQPEGFQSQPAPRLDINVYASPFDGGTHSQTSALGLQGTSGSNELQPSAWPATSTNGSVPHDSFGRDGQYHSQGGWHSNSTGYSHPPEYGGGGGYPAPYPQVDQGTHYSPAQGHLTTYRHSLPYDSASETVHDLPRHHSTPSLQTATPYSVFQAGQQQQQHGSPYPQTADAYAESSMQTHYYPQPYVDSRGPSPATVPGPDGQPSWLHSQATPASSEAPVAKGPGLSIEPPPASAVQEEQKPAKLSTVAEGKRPAADKKPSHKRSLSSASASTAAPAGGDKPAGEIKKAPLACHFCRKRKLKCDGVRPTCANCEKRNLHCTVDEVIKRRGPGKKKKERSERGAAAAAAAAANAASSATDQLASTLPPPPPMFPSNPTDKLGLSGHSIQPPHSYAPHFY